MSDMEGEMVGVGISIIYNTEYKVIEVMNVMPESPALEAGVQVGDLIVYIGEEKESVAELGYYPSVSKLQGEEGTEAVFTVYRGENYEESVDFRIKRAKITEQTVMSHVYALDSTVGVIKISGFDSKTPEQFIDAINDLAVQGCDKYVVDLRYNPGGELNSILNVLDYLLPEGPMIRIFDGNNKEVESYTSDANEANLTMAVLVNENTASAAELFTSALRDYDKALVIGTTTYGKGCMQTTIPLSDFSAVSVTYRMYNPPFSQNYHGVGIVPDVVVELDEALSNKNFYKITDEEDNQLAAAVMTFYESDLASIEEMMRPNDEDPYGQLENPEDPYEQLENDEEQSDFIKRVIKKLTEIDSIYREYYLGELDDDVLIDSMMAGYVYGTGDEYASYYNTEDFLQFITDMEGEMVGIGVSIIYNPDYKVIEVMNVMPDSPALEAGVMVGDLIVYIGEEKESVAELGYYPAVSKMQGKEGTEAVFTVYRGENYEETVEFRITRAKITEQTVMPHVYALDNTVGVIKISGFDTKTPEQFVNAINDLSAQGCDKFVVDLRYNPGGELNSILNVLDYLLPKGPMIRIFDGNNNEVASFHSDEEEADLTMAVLVNENTASAAELFTSALRDYDKALIIGTTTYGKGCMQTTIPLSDFSAVSVTYRMYNPPFSENYHGVGIVPDVIVELDEALYNKNFYKITDEEDNQLAAAVKTFYEPVN